MRFYVLSARIASLSRRWCPDPGPDRYTRYGDVGGAEGDGLRAIVSGRSTSYAELESAFSG